MSDVRNHGTVCRINWPLRSEYAVYAEGLHEPAFLVFGLITGPCHGAGVTYGARQLGLPTTDNARNNWFAEFETALVVTAWLGIKDRRLATQIALQCIGKIASRVMDIDVLSRRDQRRRSPPFRRHILGDSGGEAAGIGEDRHRALEQHLFGIVAAERAADSHAIPRICHAQAIGSENIDSIDLAQSSNLACVMDGDFLCDHHDLFQSGIDTDELRDAIADTGRRQIDDSCVEGKAGIEAFADVVEDRNIADRSWQNLAASSGRGAEDDVAAGKSVTNRRDLPR